MANRTKTTVLGSGNGDADSEVAGHRRCIVTFHVIFLFVMVRCIVTFHVIFLFVMVH